MRRKRLLLGQNDQGAAFGDVIDHRAAEFASAEFVEVNRRVVAMILIDSTVIEFCAAMFDWAKYRAAKLQLVLDHGCGRRELRLPAASVATPRRSSR